MIWKEFESSVNLWGSQTETIADVSEDSKSGAVETPPRKRKSREADKKE